MKDRIYNDIWMRLGILMNWGLCLMFSLLFLSSCKDDFDVDKLQDTPRLVVYCFPTEGDTTLIAVTRSFPVASFKGDIKVQSQQTVNARIIYKVNGVEYPVRRIENLQEARLFSTNTSETYLSRFVGQYYVVGRQKAGDNIDVQVSADGYSSVSASTYIPNRVNIQMGEVRFDEKSSDADSYSRVDKIAATFQDDASTQDYYSVMVKLRQMEGTNRDSLSWVTRAIELSTVGEPLLNKKTKLNDDFGFDDYTFFGNSYIFDDRTINGQSYTLHLEALSAYMHTGEYDDYYHTWDKVFGYDYIVELYKVTPEYYRFLKSINDAMSNEWADAGLMQVTPTYSNVNGGFGIVAGYNASTSSRHFD